MDFNISAVFVLRTKPSNCNNMDLALASSAAEAKDITSCLYCENLRNTVTSKSKKHTAVTICTIV